MEDQALDGHPLMELFLTLLGIVGVGLAALSIFLDFTWPLFISIRRILIVIVSILIFFFAFIAGGIWGGILSLIFICLTISLWCGRAHLFKLWKRRGNGGFFT